LAVVVVVIEDQEITPKAEQMVVLEVGHQMQGLLVKELLVKEITEVKEIQQVKVELLAVVVAVLVR
jgi:hypothetical protein